MTLHPPPLISGMLNKLSQRSISIMTLRLLTASRSAGRNLCLSRSTLEFLVYCNWRRCLEIWIFNVVSDLLGSAAILGLEVYILGKLATRQVQLEIISVHLFHKVTYISTTVSLPSPEIGTPLPPLP